MLAKYSTPGSYLVSFLNAGNCLGFGTFAAMLRFHSSVWLCGSAGTTTLRGRRPSGLAWACLSDSEMRCKIHRQGSWFLSWRLPGISFAELECKPQNKQTNTLTQFKDIRTGDPQVILSVLQHISTYITSYLVVLILVISFSFLFSHC